MTRTIDMCMSGYAAQKRLGYGGEYYMVHTKFDVDLDKLSPAARVIATSIYTTDRRDDLSLLWVEGPSVKEILLKDGQEEEYKLLKKAYENYVENPTVRVWPFDFLKHYETPEQYFERQAKEMKGYGWLKIKSSTLNDNINFPL